MSRPDRSRKQEGTPQISRRADSGMLRILAPGGRLTATPPALSVTDLLELHRLMVMCRRFDRKAVALQRQGRLGTYAPMEGQEAAQVGSARALGTKDWVYPGYREHGVELARGMPVSVLLAYWRGLPNGAWDPRQYRVQCISIPIATHLPHAVGHAYALSLADRGEVTVAYFGDGGTSAGDFHAALNFAGVWRTPTVFFCQNNLYAGTVPLDRQTASETLAGKASSYGIRGVLVDGMDVLAVHAATAEAVERARAREGPTLIEALTYRYGPHSTADNPRRYRSETEECEWREMDPIERYRIFLETRGLWSASQQEGLERNLDEELEAAVEALDSMEPPGREDLVRHVYRRVPSSLIKELHEAQDGAGEPLTLLSADERWQVPQERPASGPRARWTMAEALNAALHEAMRIRPETLILGEDVGLAGGVFRVTEGLREDHGEDRVIDTPLNESGIVGTAIGMALGGLRPVPEIQFGGFVYPAFDQIVSHLGRMRFRSRGHVSLPVVVRVPTGAGTGAHEHHCDSPDAHFVHEPGLVVICPSTPTDAKGLLAAALEGDDPVIFLEPKILYRAGKEDVPTAHYTVPIGRARVRREGSDVTVVTYGGMVPVCLSTADRMSIRGVSVEVIDLRTLFPWDTETVLESAGKTGRVVLVQETRRNAGVCAEIAAWLGENALDLLQAPIVRVAGLDAPWPQFAVERLALIDAERVEHAVLKITAGGTAK